MRFNFRAMLAAAVVSTAPFAVFAQGAPVVEADVNTACGSGGSAAACAAVVARLPQTSPLRALARTRAQQSGINVNSVLAISDNAPGGSGAPGTAGQNSDNTTSGQSTPASPT